MEYMLLIHADPVGLQALREAERSTALAAYGAYALTDHSIMRVWDIKLTVADMLWGTFATGVAATAGFLAARPISQ